MKPITDISEIRAIQLDIMQDIHDFLILQLLSNTDLLKEKAARNKSAVR